MIENTTKLTEDQVSETFSLRMKTGSALILRIVSGAAAVFFGAAGCVYRAMSTSPIIFGVAVVLLLFCMFGVPMLIRPKVRADLNPETPRTYIFEDDGIAASFKQDGKTMKTKVKYGTFDQVTVGEDAIYLRTLQGKGFFVLANDGYTQGSVEEALEFLKTKGLEPLG